MPIPPLSILLQLKWGPYLQLCFIVSLIRFDLNIILNYRHLVLFIKNVICSYVLLGILIEFAESQKLHQYSAQLTRYLIDTRNLQNN